MNVTFEQEFVAGGLWAEAMELLVDHWHEVAYFKDIPLRPNVAAYEAMQENGTLFCYTARLDRQKLVGYALFFVTQDLHSLGSWQAHQDVLFLTKRWRAYAATPFIKWCDAKLAEAGVQVIFREIKASKDFGALLKRQGYEQVNITYAKRLDSNRHVAESRSSE